MAPLVRLTACALAATASPLTAQGGKAATASAAVQEYIRAASDSNLARMAELFGTDKGNAKHVQLPCCKTPADVEKRMLITQAYLVHTAVRTLGELPGAKADERSVTTEISVGTCKVVTSVTAVKSSKDGWLVRNLNLDQLTDIRGGCHSHDRGNSGG